MVVSGFIFNVYFVFFLALCHPHCKVIDLSHSGSEYSTSHLYFTISPLKMKLSDQVNVVNRLDYTPFYSHQPLSATIRQRQACLFIDGCLLGEKP